MAGQWTAKITGGLQRINEKNPNSVLGLVLLVIFLVFAFPIIMQLKILSSINPQIAEMKQTLETTRNNINRLPQYQKELQDLRQQEEQINQNIRTREQLPVVLENLSRMASQFDVQIEQIMPNTAVEESVLHNEDGDFYAIPIVVEAKSAYHDFGRFLSSLERESLFLSLTDFTIATDPADPKKHDIKLSVEAVVFEKAKE